MGQMTCEYWMLKMACDLLLASWLWVAAVMRLVMPSSSRSMACLQSVTTCCDKSDLGQKQHRQHYSLPATFRRWPCRYGESSSKHM